MQHDCVLAKCMASGMQPLLHREYDGLGKLLGQHHGLTMGVGVPFKVKCFYVGKMDPAELEVDGEEWNDKKL